MATMAQITEVRSRSGAGILDCKTALEESDSNIEDALDWLRKKGLAAAAKKAGRTAAEGWVAMATDDNRTALIELNCETDFAARNPDFKELALECAQRALKRDCNVQELLDTTTDGASLSDRIGELVGRVGENVRLRRIERIEITDGCLQSYLHSSGGDNLGRIVSVVSIHSQAKCNQINEFGRKVAMHIASQQPRWVQSSDVDPVTLTRERDIIKEQTAASGKPPAIIEKMLEGRLEKFYQETCLLRQTSIFDSSQTIGQMVDTTSKEIGARLQIKGFLRMVVGEGIERAEEDFAAEVAAAQKASS